MNRLEFNDKQTLPPFLCVDWKSAKSGDTMLVAMNDILGDERNLETMIDHAKKQGIDCTIIYCKNEFIIYVNKTISKNIEIEDLTAIRLYIEDVNTNPTVTEIYENAGVKGSRVSVINTLNYMVEKNILIEKRHQHQGGGRPTKRYMIK